MGFWPTLKRDVQVIFEKDPAARNLLEVLSYPGLHAVFSHRIAHALWRRGVKTPARWLSQWTRFTTGIEIHPGAQIGQGFFIDHGSGVVIGETAVVGDDVLIYHQVTLGGTSRRKKKRHPTIGNGVTLSPGAKILGDITIGDYAKIGPNAVVRTNVAPNATVVGIPGRAVHRTDTQEWRSDDCQDHGLSEDPEGVMLNCMLGRIRELEETVQALKALLPEPLPGLPRDLVPMGNLAPLETELPPLEVETAYAQGH